MILTIIIFVLIGILFVGLIAQRSAARNDAEYINAACADIQKILHRFNELENELKSRLSAMETKQDNMYQWLNDVSNHVSYNGNEEKEYQ